MHVLGIADHSVLPILFRQALPASPHGLLTLTKVFPVVLLLCNAGAAVCYAASGDFRRSLYWIASAVCIAAITF
jgi:hypothetical protein